MFGHGLHVLVKGLQHHHRLDGDNLLGVASGIIILILRFAYFDGSIRMRIKNDLRNMHLFVRFSGMETKRFWLFRINFLSTLTAKVAGFPTIIYLGFVFKAFSLGLHQGGDRSEGGMETNRRR